MNAIPVVIVGGGPVGLATAIGLRRHGLEVTVIERSGETIDKACGEGLMPAAREPLARLGVDLDSLPGCPFEGIRYVDGGISVVGGFEGGAGRGVRRLDLHTALRRSAEESGVALRWRSRVEAIEATTDGWRLGVSSGGLDCRVLVGADGLNSTVRRLAGLSTAAPRHRRFGVRRHYRLAPLSSQVEVHWANGCEGYVTPIAADTVGVAILWSGRRVGFDELLAGLPVLRDRFASAEILSKDRGAGPFLQGPRAVLKAGTLALVGDAAGYVDALTGEGLALGFQQALTLAELIASTRMSEWPGAHRSICRTPDRLTRLTLLLSRHPRLRRRALAAFASEPQLFERFLAIQNGTRPAVPDGVVALSRLGLRLFGAGS